MLTLTLLRCLFAGLALGCATGGLVSYLTTYATAKKFYRMGADARPPAIIVPSGGVVTLFLSGGVTLGEGAVRIEDGGSFAVHSAPDKDTP